MVNRKGHNDSFVLKKLSLFCGRAGSLLSSLIVRYNNNRISQLLGEGVIIQYPFRISGIENIVAGDSVNIGVGSTIFATRAKLRVKGHFVSGPGLTIITGDHMPLVGKFLDEVSDKDKDTIDILHKYDQDVIIEEDVWCGANVTILKGVRIGRGSIIAAGSVVSKSIPPYTIAAGIPCRPIRQRWTVEQIREHEKILYPESSRLDLSLFS